MMRLSRWMLMLSVLGFLYCLAILGLLLWPWSLAVFLVAGLGLRGKKAFKALTAHGSARWATERELAGMLDAKQGPVIGVIQGTDQRWRSRMAVLDRRLSDTEACRRFFGGEAL